MTIIIFIIAYFALDAAFVSCKNYRSRQAKINARQEKQRAQEISGRVQESKPAAATEKELQRAKDAEIRRQLDESELERLHEIQQEYLNILRMTKEQLNGNISSSKRISIQKQITAINQKILAIDAKKQKLELKYQY